jgi:hypothetical protein
MVLLYILNALNKKHQTKALLHLFNVIELMYLACHLDDIGDKSYNMKMFKIYKKLIKKILIADEGIIKVDKEMLRTIDYYNKARNKKLKKTECSNIESDFDDTDSSCDND